MGRNPHSTMTYDDFKVMMDRRIGELELEKRQARDERERMKRMYMDMSHTSLYPSTQRVISVTPDKPKKKRSFIKGINNG